MKILKANIKLNCIMMLDDRVTAAQTLRMWSKLDGIFIFYLRLSCVRTIFSLKARSLSGSAFCNFRRLGVPEQSLGGWKITF